MRDLPAGLDVLRLVRRHEPVLRFTAGEMFFPMPVEDYVARASLWASPQDGDTAVKVLDHGRLDALLLAAALEHPNAGLFLRYAPKALQRHEVRAWRKRPDRPTFTGVSRLAAVGLLGR